MSTSIPQDGAVPEPHLPVAYHQGAFKPLQSATVNIMTHGFQYGIGCFAGVRAYYDDKAQEAYIFRLDDHVERIWQSTRILGFNVTETREDIYRIILEVAKRNAFRGDCYFRPFFYSGEHRLSPRTHDVRVDFAVYAIPLGDYLDTSRGLKTVVSSWRRVDDDVIPARAKASGAYLNSALAKSEAVRQGCDEAIFLNRDGTVCEGSAENIFIVRDGVLTTPSVNSNILEGITRRTLLEIARDELGVSVAERPIARSELYVADEVFFSGTGAQVAWIEEIDGRKVGTGEIGEVARELRALYRRVVLGKVANYSHWLTPVFKSQSAAFDERRLAGR